MALKGIIQHAPAGVNGFDVNRPLTHESARDFKDAGYDFCVRYLPRHPTQDPGNLTEVEGEAILWAGLSLLAVQHVALPGWMPTIELGAEYGSFAAQYAKEVAGLPEGICIFLDLEEVANQATSEDVIGYCGAWFSAVNNAGYIPSLYVGWNVKLDAQQLYYLPFKHYWRAYNTDTDIATRGYQMIQHTQKTLNGITFDPNTMQNDHLGDSIIWLAPA